MPLYVINLERSTDRLVRIREQFSQIGLDFIRIEAVDACALSDVQCGHIQAQNIWMQSLTHGEVACFLSHHRALEKFVADNRPYGVIFEDDVMLGRRAGQLLARMDWLDKIADKTGDVVDIIKLETSGKKLWLGQRLVLIDQRLETFSLARIKSTHIMAAAYLVSRAAALRLLGLMQHASAPFDHFLFNFSLGNAQKFGLYQLDPAIAIQIGIASTLEDERAKDKNRLRAERGLGQTLVREMRRLFRRAGRGLWGVKTNLFTVDQWKRVPFSR